jgi:hypothetical protein
VHHADAVHVLNGRHDLRNNGAHNWLACAPLRLLVQPAQQVVALAQLGHDGDPLWREQHLAEAGDMVVHGQRMRVELAVDATLELKLRARQVLHSHRLARGVAALLVH